MKNIFLATSTTCGPCFMLKNRITKEELTVEIKLLEEDYKWFKKHEIKLVPQLVIIEDSVVTKIQGQDDIIKYLKDLPVVENTDIKH